MQTRAALLVVALLVASPVTAADPSDVVLRTKNLVAFWDFREANGGRVDRGPHQFRLREVGGPIPRVVGGPFSGYAAAFDGKHYLRLPHAELGALDMGGPDAQVSMFAVARVDEMKRGVTIAGIWSEGKGANDDTGTRQYAILLNMPAYGGPRQLTPHVSSEGGVSRRRDGSGLPWCADYAASRSEVPVGRWCTLGFTYDGKYVRAYFNGVMEERTVDPKKDRRDDRYFTTEGPDGEHRGINPYYHGRGIFRYDAKKHAKAKPDGGADFTVAARYAVGSMLGEALKGRIAGLAVFDRALTAAEMKRLHEAANVATLPNASAR
ncbi:MAG: hypothetical protein U0736_04270 [Gemmataceae bacterium]